MESRLQLLNIQFGQQFRLLPPLIEQLPKEKIYQKAPDGKWSIHEQIAHLGRYQEVFEARLQLLLEQGCPNLGRYKAENDPLFPSWIERDTSINLAALMKKRQKLIATIQQTAFSEGDVFGIHPKLGKLSFTDWLSFFLFHEGHHLLQIFKLSKF